MSAFSLMRHLLAIPILAACASSPAPSVGIPLAPPVEYRLACPLPEVSPGEDAYQVAVTLAVALRSCRDGFAVVDGAWRGYARALAD